MNVLNAKRKKGRFQHLSSPSPLLLTHTHTHTHTQSGFQAGFGGHVGIPHTSFVGCWKGEWTGEAKGASHPPSSAMQEEPVALLHRWDEGSFWMIFHFKN